MIDINSIAEQVKRNCDISDARYVIEKYRKGEVDSHLKAQIRDLYITEMGIKPWEKRIPLKTDPNFQSWFTEKKKLWKELRYRNFSRITVNGREYSHTYMDEMNQELNPEGYFYSASMGYGHKISFLLAQLVDTRKENDYGIYILGKELARDLDPWLTATALQVEGCLIGRNEALRNYFWKKIKTLKSDKHPPEKKILEQAFHDFGFTKTELSAIPEEVDKEIEKILPKKMEVNIHHEKGHEITQKFNYVLIPELFHRLITLVSGTELEWFIRGIDEVLADTTVHKDMKGMLGYIIDQKDSGSLSLRVYDTIVNVKSNKTHWKYYTKIFPELIPAYEKFRITEDWGFIEEARKVGEERATKLVRKLRDSHDIDSIKSICEKVING